MAINTLADAIENARRGRLTFVQQIIEGQAKHKQDAIERAKRSFPYIPLGIEIPLVDSEQLIRWRTDEWSKRNRIKASKLNRIIERMKLRREAYQKEG